MGSLSPQVPLLLPLPLAWLGPRKEKKRGENRDVEVWKEERRNHRYDGTISFHNIMFGYITTHCIHTHIHMHACTHTHIHAHTFTDTDTHTHTQTHAHTHKYVPLLCCAISSPLLCRDIWFSLRIRSCLCMSMCDLRTERQKDRKHRETESIERKR